MLYAGNWWLSQLSVPHDPKITKKFLKTYNMKPFDPKETVAIITSISRSRNNWSTWLDSNWVKQFFWRYSTWPFSEKLLGLPYVREEAFRYDTEAV